MDILNKSIQSHTAGIRAFAAYGYCLTLDFFISHNHQYRDPEKGNLTDSLAKCLIPSVYGSANIGIIQETTNFFCIIRIFFTHWQHFNLIGREPERQVSGGVLEHYSCKPFH